VLSKVQEAVEVEGELVKVTRELKQAALRQLFTRGLRGESQKETEIGPVPESWEVVPLKQVCVFASGGTPSKSEPLNWGCEIPWVSPKDMKRPRLFDTIDHITQAGLESGSRLVPAGTLLVVIRGMILMRNVPVALTMVPMAFNQDIKAILPGEKLAPDFLLYAFEAFRQLLFNRVGTSAHGTRTLSSSALETFLIPLPTPDEQRSIATILRAIDDKIAYHEDRQRLLSELFRTLLHDLMTGRRRVAGAEAAASLEGVA
jgi:type I restriction enzyme S subunit